MDVWKMIFPFGGKRLFSLGILVSFRDGNDLQVVGCHNNEGGNPPKIIAMTFGGTS